MVEELALILRSVRYQDAAKIITFFSKEGGVRTGFARGATARDNRFGASLEPLTLCRISGRSGGNRTLYRLHHADIQTSYRRIHADFNRLTWSGLVIRFLLGLLPPEHPEPTLFDQTVETLGALDEGTEPSRLIWLRYVREGLSILGYRPLPPQCIHCHQEGLRTRMIFHPEDGTILCYSCRKEKREKGIEVETSVLAWFSNPDPWAPLYPQEQVEAMTFVDEVIRQHDSRWISAETLSFLPDIPE